MMLDRYYIPPGMFDTYAELMNDINTPDRPVINLWGRYKEGSVCITVWVKESGLDWGFIGAQDIDWALDRGYQLFVRTTEEVLI